LGSGLSLLALTWLCGPGPAIHTGRRNMPSIAVNDGFVLIDGWVLPASYFRE
jgi:hypothetical protein